jgi:kynurenine formamidase
LADLDGVVVRAEERKDRAVGREYFQNVAVANRAVIVHTGWAKHWRTDQYSEGHPFLTEDAAKYLVMAGAALVGIDSFNIDDTADKCRPAHTILLQASIPIVEHMCGIENLPDDDFKFFAVAAKVKEFGSFPVRAFAIAYNS